MPDKRRSFHAGVDFESVLRIISKQIYETPLAFIRENVQNAVDAIRIQALREGVSPDDERYAIKVFARSHDISVQDNGIGMSASDLENYFWTIGASGKRTDEALAAGCVGTFGIGGFANFGVCDELEVISQKEGEPGGTLTRLTEIEIKQTHTTSPSVTMESSNAAGPRGTIVNGHLREAAAEDQLRRYLKDFVTYVPTAVFFNGDKLSQRTFSDLEDRENLTEISGATQIWREGDLMIRGRLYEDRGNALLASIESMKVGAAEVALTGRLRFESGTIDVFKRGFKLCATQIGSIIGVSGRVDSDRFVPTAGRDSLDSTTTAILNRIIQLMESVAVQSVLESPARIAQHTRIFRYIVKRGFIDKLEKVRVNLADGSDSALGDIRRRYQRGGVGVFFGIAQKQALNQIMQARGHLVVILSADRFRRDAERAYLQRFCEAKAFDGIIDCVERYTNLTRFDKTFLSEVEFSVTMSYEVSNYRLIPGKLTEDIPVFVKEHGSNQPIDIFVDVRHREITKLEPLGYGQFLFSLIATFVREYLGPSLKKFSPRFFGDGALNLEMLAKKRSELWVLLKDDIGVVRQGGRHQVVRRSDVRVVNVGGGGQSQQDTENQPGRPPRILQVVDDRTSTGIAGYYIRLPDTAFNAYGDLLPGLDSRGVVWAGNKIEYVASDTVSAAFQYEIRLDEVVGVNIEGQQRAEGAIQLEQPLQSMFGGLYFPIPPPLEPFLVPHGDSEIRLELMPGNLIDMRTAKHWTPREELASSG